MNAPVNRSARAVGIVTLMFVSMMTGVFVVKFLVTGSATPSAAHAEVSATRPAEPLTQQELRVQQARAASQLQTLRSQLELYRLQHEDELPDFGQYPRWEQLVEPTSPDGTLNPASGKRFGPYLQRAYANPLNDLVNVVVVKEAITPELRLSQKAGYIYSTASERLMMTDATGRGVWDEQIIPMSQEARGPASGRGPSASWSSRARDGRRQASQQARYASLMSTLMTVRSQIELYKLQHADRLPDLGTLQWTQLTSRTTLQGQPGKDGMFGPYLQTSPTNPLNGQSGIAALKTAPAADYLAPSGIGFVLDESTGKFWGVDEQGRIWDEKY